MLRKRKDSFGKGFEMLAQELAQDSFLPATQIQGLEISGEETRGSPPKPVVPDALEEVQRLLQAVGLVVLPDDHVVAAAGNHEDDGSHIFGTRKQKQCTLEEKMILDDEKTKMSLKSREAHGFRTIEALDPFAAFITLAAHVEHAAGEK